MYDVMILGGGPAGRTAALYCARSALRCIVLEGTPGGQMALTQHVDNYPGLPDADGFVLAQKMREQAQRARRETPGRGGSAEDSPGGRRYRVQSGDTLGRIAVKFYGSAAKSEGIRRANRLPEGAVLRIGQELILPAE